MDKHPNVFRIHNSNNYNYEKSPGHGQFSGILRNDRDTKFMLHNFFQNFLEDKRFGLFVRMKKFIVLFLIYLAKDNG